ncbi:hypothetical protein Tco_0524075 [Tanacetum coccineum]
MAKGLRQGDPLAPFLFIAAEGLNMVINEEVKEGSFKGVKVGHENVVVSQLQNADDTIIFGEWSRHNGRNLMGILKCFEEAS